MTVSDNFVESKLNMRIGSEGVTREYGTDVIARADIRGDVSAHGNKMSDVITSKLPYQGQSKKRGPVTILENSIEKRRKMDRGIKILCNNMLKDLQNHRCGFPFRKPVDPVAYNIPNYFSVVKKPMDFGTIGSKLENNVYFSIDEFAADVRLTFSNCMLFNPPFNKFHVMARELSNYFESKWKFVEKKLKLESKNALNKSISNGNKEVTRGRIMMDRTAYPSMVSSINRRKMYVEEKQKLRKDLKELLKGNMTEKLQSISKKYNLFNLKESIDMGLDAMDDEVLWELKRTTKNMLKVTAGKVEATKGTQSSACSLSDKHIDKCIDNVRGVSCPSTKLTPPASSLTSKCGSCGSLSCRCSFSSNKVRSCKNFASKTEKHSGQKDASRTDLYQENLTASRSDALDLDGNGWTPATDINMSPKKALRAAMLKSRFADTIFKARQITLLDQVIMI
ncbi:hypothetical protein Leryth_018197 [Lithospermum erythrorhizon]|nr:hypothetical protein Leryth_018197 [Lithospermum erythrorhizon]